MTNLIIGTLENGNASLHLKLLHSARQILNPTIEIIALLPSLMTASPLFPRISFTMRFYPSFLSKPVTVFVNWISI